jgi:hypothetical protein
MSVAGSVNVKAQVDDDNIQKAKNALGISHSCDDALHFLAMVSADGRQKPDYYLEMGQANDCKTNTAQAIYYYNKYLEYQPANDSIKKRVAELTDKKTQDAKVADESRIAKNLYQGATKNKKKNRLNLSENYYSIGIGYGLATGGTDAPYKSSFELNSDYGFPVAKNKLLLEWSFNLDFLTNPSTDWFARAFQIPSSEVSGIGSSINYNISVGVMPVLLNKKDISLAAGPLLGIGISLLPDMGDYTFSSNNIFSFYYGLRGDLILGEYTIVYLQYAHSGTNTVTAELPIGVTNSITNNQGMLTFGVRLKLNRWWW